MDTPGRSPQHPPEPTPRPVVTVADPGDLVSAVPYLVGFTPQRSVVVVSLRGTRLRCGVVARADLPRAHPDHRATTQDVVDQLVTSVLRDAPAHVVVLVYDDAPFLARQPAHQDLVTALTSGFGTAGVQVKDLLYVTGDRFWSYRCTDPHCCPAAGNLLDHVQASPVAATLVAHGRAPLPTREDLRRQVRARGPMTSAAVTYAAAVEQDRPQGPDQDGPRSRTLRLFGLLVLRRLAPVPRHPRPGPPGGHGPVAGRGATPDEAGRVLAGLADIHTRDAVALQWTTWLRALPSDAAGAVPVGRAGHLLDAVAAASATSATSGPTGLPTGLPGIGPGIDEQLCERAVTDVLLDLATLADGELAVPALVLLAMQAWAAGEGALANVAVERSLRLDPGYRMAHLVDQLLCRGVAPRWVREQRAADHPPSHYSGRNSN